MRTEGIDLLSILLVCKAQTQNPMLSLDADVGAVPPTWMQYTEMRGIYWCKLIEN